MTLVTRGLAPSRERAQGLILAGRVRVDGRRVDKAGSRVASGAAIEVAGPEVPFVSRGGVKLAHAIDAFGVDPTGRVAIDLGSSTGGFTDCLLQRGAAKVYAVDVGHGQLDPKIRGDRRVVVMERQNVRHLERGRFAEAPSLAVADLSFISLTLVLPKIRELTAPDGDAIVLVKPQFEVGRGKVGKGGVVRDERARAEAVEAVERAALAAGFTVRGKIESPIRGAKGNVEILLHLGG